VKSGNERLCGWELLGPIPTPPPHLLSRAPPVPEGPPRDPFEPFQSSQSHDAASLTRSNRAPANVEAWDPVKAFNALESSKPNDKTPSTVNRAPARSRNPFDGLKPSHSSSTATRAQSNRGPEIVEASDFVKAFNAFEPSGSNDTAPRIQSSRALVPSRHAFEAFESPNSNNTAPRTLSSRALVPSRDAFEALEFSNSNNTAPRTLSNPAPVQSRDPFEAFGSSKPNETESRAQSNRARAGVVSRDPFEAFESVHMKVEQLTTDMPAATEKLSSFDSFHTAPAGQWDAMPVPAHHSRDPFEALESHFSETSGRSAAMSTSGESRDPFEAYYRHHAARPWQLDGAPAPVESWTHVEPYHIASPVSPAYMSLGPESYGPGQYHTYHSSSTGQSNYMPPYVESVDSELTDQQ